MCRMIRRKLRFAAVVVGVAGLVAGVHLNLTAQEANEYKAPRRLPPYYAGIVTELQRQKIYALQEEYDVQIAALAAQLVALEKKRDSEIEDVLNAAQKEKLKQAREAAAARKKSTAAANKALEEAKAAAAAAAAAPVTATKKRK